MTVQQLLLDRLSRWTSIGFYHGYNHDMLKGPERLLESRHSSVRDGARALQVMFARLENVLNLTVEEIEVQAVLGEIVKKAQEYSMATSALINIQYS